MKQSFRVIVPALMIAACNKGPEVDLHNASAGQVATAVQQSSVATSATIEPGLWDSKVTMSGMQMPKLPPNLPPEYAARAKAAMANAADHTSRHCIKPEDLKQPNGNMFAQDKACRFDHFAMGGGKIDAKMVCKVENLTHTTTMAGSYTPTTYSADMTSTGTGPQMGQTMKMHVDAKRIGECSGKED